MRYPIRSQSSTEAGFQEQVSKKTRTKTNGNLAEYQVRENRREFPWKRQTITNGKEPMGEESLEWEFGGLSI